MQDWKDLEARYGNPFNVWEAFFDGKLNDEESRVVWQKGSLYTAFIVALERNTRAVEKQKGFGANQTPSRDNHVSRFWKAT